jgi:hypothetical protein
MFNYALKMIGTLFAARPPLQGAASRVHTGLCYQAGEGRDAATLCHVGAYEMPAFVFFAAFLILVFFGFMTWQLVSRSRRRAQLLNAVAEAFETGGAGKRALPELRERFGSATSGDRRLQGCWAQFEEGLVPAPAGSAQPHSPHSQWFAARAAEESFPVGAIVDEEVGASFFAAVPALLTGFGLLMTFVAILDGLSHVSVSSSMDVVGIPGLINGLSGKFVSSIVALGCAVAFTTLERIHLGRLERAHRRMVEALGRAFPKLTTEQILASIQGQLLQQISLQSRQIELLSQLQGRAGATKGDRP